MAFAALIAGQSMVLGLAVNLSPPTGATRVALHAALAASAVVVFLLVGLPLTRSALARPARAHRLRAAISRGNLRGVWRVGRLVAHRRRACLLRGRRHPARVLHVRSRDRRSTPAAALEAARALGEEFDTCERVESNGSTTRTPARNIRAGDEVLVPAGAGIPIDGVVSEGEAL